MRCYHFGNYYMSSIQQGVQSAHCQMELFVKYKEIDLYDYGTSIGSNPPIHIYEAAEKADMLFDWARNHKTMICLNAGNNKQLNDVKEFFQQEDNKFPWSYFNEDEDSLGSILTNVCIVVPEEIYETASKIRTGDLVLLGNEAFDKYCAEMFNKSKAKYSFTDFEVKLIELLNSCQLAK